MAQSAAGVRRARDHADLQLAATTLSAAFAKYAISQWLLADSVQPDQARLELFLVLVKDLAARGGRIELSTGGEGVAIWFPPEGIAARTLPETLRPLLELLPTTGIHGVARLMRMEQAMANFHPREPHFYLCLIGVRPEFQRLGFGGQLIGSGLIDADAQSMGTFLETSEQSNLTFYRRFGFEVRDIYMIAKGSPRTWTMWRRPADK